MQDAFWVNSPLRSVIDGLMHQTDSLTSEETSRHSLFIGVHLCVGLLALAALPLVLLAAGSNFAVDTSPLALLPVWMLAPLLSVAYLSKTGKLANAFLLTASMTATFTVWIASMTGGLYSPHLVWLAIIPLEVALAGNARLIKLLCFDKFTVT